MIFMGWGYFRVTPKGTKIASNLNELGEIYDKSDVKYITLKNDAIFVHIKEACGGGHIYWDDYEWHSIMGD